MTTLVPLRWVVFGEPQNEKERMPYRVISMTVLPDGVHVARVKNQECELKLIPLDRLKLVDEAIARSIIEPILKSKYHVASLTGASKSELKRLTTFNPFIY